MLSSLRCRTIFSSSHFLSLPRSIRQGDRCCTSLDWLCSVTEPCPCVASVAAGVISSLRCRTIFSSLHFLSFPRSVSHVPPVPNPPTVGILPRTAKPGSRKGRRLGVACDWRSGLCDPRLSSAVGRKHQRRGCRTPTSKLPQALRLRIAPCSVVWCGVKMRSLVCP